MSIHLRNGIWYIDIAAPSGKRIRRTTGTSGRQAALELHDKIKHELWRQEKIGDKPQRSWDEACIRWIKEKSHKKSLQDDKDKIRVLTQFRGMMLQDMSRDFIMHTVGSLPCGNSTKNRYLALIRAILNKCADEWDWIDRAPKLKQYKEPKRRIRWLQPHEAQRLIAALPYHVAQMAVFSLCTGLRQRNVLDLEWSQIDMKRKVAWYYPDQTKSGRAHGVPLNDIAMQVLEQQRGKHPVSVFLNGNGTPAKSISSRIWREALARAVIDNFRWHDLRHTWASWLVQRGVPLLALQEMGGWENVAMVQKYAHLAPEHLHQHTALLNQTLETNQTPLRHIYDTNGKSSSMLVH